MTTEAGKVPHFDLAVQYEELREEILSALDRVCRNTSFILGEEVEQFEREFAAFCGARHCVGLNSGTSALHLALLAVGVQPGDEVITSPNSFIATAEAITYCGARPVFVDIDPATANLDASRITSAITPNTRAILPVHLYGRPADLDEILSIARPLGIAVVEDAAQAHGALYRNRAVGALADVGAFSFYPPKNLGAYGEAGALVTNDDRMAQFARMARAHGQTGRYAHDFVGYNYRMEGFQAAVLRVKLRHFQEFHSKRLALVQQYRDLLSQAQVTLPKDDPRDACAYHQFVVYLDRRDAVRAALDARGIGTVVHYPRPLHLQPAYASLGLPQGTFPHAERACERVLSLPLFSELDPTLAAQAAVALIEIVGNK